MPQVRGISDFGGVTFRREGPRMFQCFECDQPDPIKTDKAMGWLKGELQPPK